MCKRQEFAHEKEVRCIVLGVQGLSEVRVDVSINDFVESIRIQPTAPEWIRKAIEQLIKRYPVKVPVFPSEIGLPPLAY